MNLAEMIQTFLALSKFQGVKFGSDPYRSI